MRGTILVTGGTGKTGAALASRLRDVGVPVRVASRSAVPGAEQVVFDWFNEATYGPALNGAAGVYLVAPAGVTDPERVMVPFLRSAKEAGLTRAVLLSSSAIPEGGPALGQVHAAVREMMPEWSVLQPSWFMQNFSQGFHTESIKEDGEIITATGDGKVGFIDTADVAEVAFRTLTDPEPHNRAYVLTGPEALSYAEATAILSSAALKPVHHISISAAQLIERLVGFGIPADYAALLAGLDEGIRNGAEDRVTTAVQDVTGRAPKPLAEFARENAAAWR